MVFFHSGELCLQTHEHDVRPVDADNTAGFSRTPHYCLTTVCPASGFLVFRVEPDVVFHIVQQGVEGIESAVLEVLAHPVFLIFVCPLPFAASLPLESLVGDAQVQSIEIMPEGEVCHCPLGESKQMQSIVAGGILTGVCVLYLLHQLALHKRQQEHLLRTRQRGLHLLERQRG